MKNQENMQQMRETTQQEKVIFKRLNEVSEEGSINMFESPRLIKDEYDIDLTTAIKLVKTWMENFNDDGNYDQVKI